MQLSELRTQSRRYTRTNSTNYLDATLDADINIANGEIWMTILEAEGYKNTGGDFKVINNMSTVGLVAQDLGFNGEYPFPSTALQIDSAEISYDGTKWYQAEVIDKRDCSSSIFSEEQYNDEYSQQYPKIFIFRDSYFIRPTLDVAGDITDGIKLSIIARQDTLALTTDSPSFESNFHNLIPLKVAQDYSLIYPEKANPRIDAKIQILESQLISFYQDRTPIDLKLKALPQERGLNNW